MIHKSNKFVCLLLMLLLHISAFAQTKSEKLTVSIEITSFSDSSVSFSWSNFSINTTDIYRKKISDDTWTLLTTGTTASTYTDNTISTEVEYEYKFKVNTNVSSPSEAFGYIAFGVKIPQKTTRGDILLLIDDRFTSSLSDEIFALQRDLISDGWNPITAACSKDSSANCVKSAIDSINNVQSLEAIYMIGHIPVPYSGVIAPDGHVEHVGAWPTDLYYVSTSSSWTDNTANYSNSYRADNTNVPYDGKFDVSYLQDEVTCPISRIDFYNLPSAENSEIDMLRNYLNEASKYKNGLIEVKEKGLVDDQIPNHYDGFASNGYRNFGSLFGDSITKSNMLSSLEGDTYKWTYATGYGTDTSMSGIGSISTLKNSSYKGIFSMTFGSYFGDWNTEDNLMRSLLADGKMLTTCWAGRPNWFFHHMGLNNPIALSAKMSIENGSGYSPLNTTEYDVAGYAQNNVHMELLGDLTLRQNYHPAVANFDVSYDADSNYFELSWDQPSNNNIVSFEIYKSQDSTSGYTLLTSLSSTATTYIDRTVNTLNFYYIKYVSLDSTLSGSYYNNSTGSFYRIDTSNLTNAAPLPVQLLNFKASKREENAFLQWSTATEINFSHFEIEKSSDLTDWEVLKSVNGSNTMNQINNYSTYDYNLGVGKTYYRLKMIDYDGHYNYSGIEVLETEALKVNIYPNPATTNSVTITSERDISDKDFEDIRVFDYSGRDIPYEIDTTSGKLTIGDIKGVYFIHILGETKRVILL